MSDIIDRLNGNGEPWTFAEVIAEIERLRAALADIADPPEHYTINDCRCVAAAALAQEKPND